MSCAICNRPVPVDPMRPYVDQTLEACRACWVEEDQRSEGLELEFCGELLEPLEYVFPKAPSTLRAQARERRRAAAPPAANPAPASPPPAPRRRAGRPPRRDLRAEQTRLEQQIARARRRLAARGYHVEAA